MNLRSSIFAILAVGSFTVAQAVPVGPESKGKDKKEKTEAKAKEAKKDAEMTDAEVLKAYDIDPAILKKSSNKKPQRKHHGAL